MAGPIKQITVYAKVTLIVAIFLGVATIIFKNRSYETKFWPWAVLAPVSTLWLMLATSVVSVVVFWLLSKMRRVWRELADLRLQKAAQERQAEEDQRRRQLDEQERRIDDKIKKALGPENSQGNH
ncbi:MAG TPA: hypothetical protein VJZ71_20545 [Phycisphaerae bacterium]|nr:hypothetical protein [Phycisphaerae bacterium]